MDMTFKGFYQNAVGIQIVLMDLATLPQSNVGLSRGVMAPTTYWILLYINIVNVHFPWHPY